VVDSGDAALGCHVVINEIQVAGTGTGTGDTEFVEIYNPGTTATDLNGNSIVYRAASNGKDSSPANDSTTFYKICITGSPASVVPAGSQSIGRFPTDGKDTNNNSADFHVTTAPTPKAANS